MNIMLMCCVVLRMDTGHSLKSGNQLEDNIEERKELRIMIAIPRIVLFVWWRCGDQELRAGRGERRCPRWQQLVTWPRCSRADAAHLRDHRQPLRAQLRPPLQTRQRGLQRRRRWGHLLGGRLLTPDRVDEVVMGS